MLMTWIELGLLVTAAVGSLLAARWARQARQAAQAQKAEQATREALEILRHEQKQHYFQIEALFSLYQQLTFNAPLPQMRRWAISPDCGRIIVDHVQRLRPQLVVEASSGLSTLLTAYALRQNGSGRVVAIDHDAYYAQVTRDLLARHGLDDIATVFHAPLAALELDGETWQWYDTAALPDLDDIDLLMVDGPPQHGNVQALVRYPAMPVFYDGLRGGATVIMDDAHRADETAIIERWKTRYGLEQIAHHETEKGTVILRKPDR